jgi:hypothetical protein
VQIGNLSEVGGVRPAQRSPSGTARPTRRTSAASDTRYADVQRLAKYLRQRRHEWFLFLYDPDIPATNNLAERQIRPSMILSDLGVILFVRV